MKKLLISVFAVAAALFATSCAQDGIDSSAVKGEEAVVTFAVNAPEMATRAFGDGKSAKDLYYAVYNVENQLIEEISLLDTPADGEFDSNLNRNVSIRLANDETYSLIFFAQAPTGGAANIDWATQTMEFNPTKMSEEAYDAFWAYVKPFKVNGAATHNVTLTRPFAQIIFGAGDWDEAVASQMEVKQTQLVVTTPSKMNLVSGLTSEPKAFTYAYAELPSEAFPAAYAGHKHLGMAYLLFGADKGMVDVTFNYMDANDAEHTRNFPAVFVQRNYRTTVYGNLLTSNNDFDVNINPDDDDIVYEGWTYVSNWSEFLAALNADNKYIMLAENITYNASYTLAKNVTINLNGKSMEISDPAQSLSLKGDITIANGAFLGKMNAAGGNLVLDGVNFEGTIKQSSTEASLQVAGVATLVAKNCTFNATQDSSGAKNSTRPLSMVGRSSGSLKFENCSFKSNTNQGQVYVNELKGTATLEFLNCNFNNKTPNITLGAEYDWKNFKMSGTTKLSSITLEMHSRTKSSITEYEYTYLNTMMADNNFSSVRIFTSDQSSGFYYRGN